MKHVTVITLITGLGLVFGCGRSDKPKESLTKRAAKTVKDETVVLRRRAEAFGALLLRIQDMPESTAGKTLEGFIEPSPTRADRIAQYYSEFSAASKKFRIVSQSVANIRINSDQVNAEVEYRTIAQPPGGAQIPVKQVTRWERVGDTWYRTIGDAQKELE